MKIVISNYIVLFFVAFFANLISLNAQEMRPLDQQIETAANPYPFVRCGGLYLAMMQWIGAKRMGPDSFEQSMDAYSSALAAAVLQNVLDGAGDDMEQIAESSTRDAKNIADIYTNRFEKNYAVIGQAFGEDELIKSDLATCRLVIELARDMYK
jgi:hypothetical protein